MNKIIVLCLLALSTMPLALMAMDPEPKISGPRKGQGTVWAFDDGHDITVYSDNEKILIEENFKTLELDATGKPHFTDKYGEDVVEYSGLATDQNAERSWARAEFVPEGFSRVHYHNERTEDYYVVEGTAHVSIDGKLHEFNAGDHIQILPHQVHCVVNPSDKAKLVIIVKCSPAWVASDHLPQ